MRSVFNAASYFFGSFRRWRFWEKSWRVHPFRGLRLAPKDRYKNVTRSRDHFSLIALFCITYSFQGEVLWWDARTPQTNAHFSYITPLTSVSFKNYDVFHKSQDFFRCFTALKSWYYSTLRINKASLPGWQVTFHLSAFKITPCRIVLLNHLLKWFKFFFPVKEIFFWLAGVSGLQSLAVFYPDTYILTVDFIINLLLVT